MTRPKTLQPVPAIVLTLLGGLVGVLLHTATLFVAPVMGLPFIDLPRLIGGVFVASPEGAFWLGVTLHMLGGVLLLGPLLGVAWSTLPGRGIGFGGALIKGVLWGVAIALATGVLLPLLGAINRLDGMANPGLFAVGPGMGGVLALVLASILFGVAAAIIAAMPQGISPFETVGLPSHYRALQPPDPALVWDDVPELPRWPFTGSR